MEESHNACSEEGASLFLTNELHKLHSIRNTPRVRQETTTDSLLREHHTVSKIAESCWLQLFAHPGRGAGGGVEVF